MNFSDSSKKYSYDEYRSLIGKSTMIKKEYFIENSIDMKVFNTLMEYSKRNIFHAVISDISEEIDEKTNKFIKATSKVSLYPPIGNTRYLDVPLEYLVGGYFSITEDKISFLHSKTERPAPLVEYEGRGAPGLFFPAHAHTDDEWTALERERELEQGAWKEKLKQGDDDPNLEKLLETIFHTLEKTVIHLSLTIYDTDVLIPQKQKQDIIKELMDKEFIQVHAGKVVDSTQGSESTNYDYLIKMSLYLFTEDELDKLESQITLLQNSYDDLFKLTVEEIWLSECNLLLKRCK
jgi:hypothetical protein